MDPFNSRHYLAVQLANGPLTAFTAAPALAVIAPVFSRKQIHPFMGQKVNKHEILQNCKSAALLMFAPQQLFSTQYECL